MIDPAYCQLLARYNRWMNERLCAVVGAFDEAERTRDRGAFFGSMQRTLSHLVWADRIWLARFAGEPFDDPAYGADQYTDFPTLVREREAADMRILDWAGQLTPQWLDDRIVYRSAADGRLRALPNWVAAVHLFNHSTHHRGQLTTLITQAGGKPGITDLPWLPGVASVLDESPVPV
jgi:uncharacterized damage-inducible protein DinB